MIPVLNKNPEIVYEITKPKRSFTADCEAIYRRQVKTIYRVCYGFMKNKTDAEDCVADTFCKLFSSEKTFESEIHEKSFLIRIASNICKNKLKHWSRTTLDIDEQTDLETEDKVDDTLKIVLELPEKYKNVIYLYYYEEYNTEEIAKILKKNASTVRSYLSEARSLLKEKLGDSYEN
jgi:RNA polymerase sigma-70 factor (ECF subfamily)